MKRTLTLLTSTLLGCWLAAQNVGIGTNTPGSKLHIADGELRLADPNSFSGFLLATPGHHGYYGAWALYGITSGNLHTNPFIYVVRSTGNVGIGTISPTAQLHTTGTVRFANYASGPNSAILRTDNFGNLAITNFTGNAGDVLLGNATFGSVNNLAWRLTGNSGTNPANHFIGTTDAQPLVFRTNNTENMRITETGDVGIGTNTPASRLDVRGKATITRTNTIECCGNDATLALGENTTLAGNPRASISFHNGGEAEGTIRLIQNTINGVSSRRIEFFDNQNQGLGLQLSGRLWYGLNGTRTERRDDAGLSAGNGAQSGFFETPTPSNYPVNDGNWWHLIDVRHSNTSNNYAMQIAGSFFNQRIYFRKLNNNPSQPWYEFITTYNMNEFVWKLDGNANINAASHFIGTTDNNPLIFRTNNTEKMRITQTGNVGIGTASPAQRLHVAGTVRSDALAGPHPPTQTYSLLGTNTDGDIIRTNPLHSYMFTFVQVCENTVEGSVVAQILNGNLTINVLNESGQSVKNCVFLPGGVANAWIQILIVNDDIANCGSPAKVSIVRSLTVSNNGGSASVGTDMGCSGSDGNHMVFFIHYNIL